ncbi:autotransporter domain-containing protein [Hoeflea sp. WL0058]|uniref:Autotransporter domain-containing protein n=1 Tax=Flavimaribacter sediminis TaxID=2865987 RepID=A0AAE2ZRA0_9HYPH|nr:autotransporter outer membrane beta-barrel domain-containing protein [Flavimaribacter sediminis]MBW8640676.1 autotransporter domain-containing protein [Flavimaribacter sediminis]
MTAPRLLNSRFYQKFECCDWHFLKNKISIVSLISGIFLVSLIAVCFKPVPASAACTIDGTITTCTGSGLGPISYTEADAVDEIILEDLTDDVSGSDGTAISLTETGTDGSDDGDDGSSSFPATVTFDGTNGSDTYGVTDATDSSIIVTTTGGEGHEGENKSGRHETGGDGGDGGSGSAVSLTMSGGFVSQTEGGTGIDVSNTGGAGGKGGEGSYTGDSFDDSDLYGGTGGAGGAADTATLTIGDLTNPDSSYGIDLSGVDIGISLASTGGQGGQGGEARCDAGDSTCKSYSGVGGAGGASGDAKATITDTEVSISDFSDTGIEILSTGGNGGQGGLAKAIYASNKVENKPSNGYGDGGDGGDAGTAAFTVTDSAIIGTDTDGEAIYGVVVSSTGGAGGDGNDSYTGGAGSDAVGDHPGWGSGGDGGNGGESSLTLTGSEISLSMSADDAVGILVSSVGDSGGDVGTTTSDVTDWANDPDEGGNGGAGGDGGSVSGTMDSSSVMTVTTTGEGGSMGALTLLSQGGDGGDGGSGGEHGDGNGGAGGAGGSISGTMTTVSATTSGDDAYGIYLASVGGDGGTGKAGDGSGGDAGAIDVSFSSVTVQASGDGSHGVYALSQGGAGGDSSSDGDGGDADWISLTVTGGTVEVTGEDAYGIAAISSAGSAGSGDTGDSAGYVKLTTGADVTVSGSGGIGLYAASSGGTTSGQIEVTVDTGGVITASDDASAAVSIVNGNGNTLTNDGTITTDDLTSTSIYALMTSGGDLAVTNNGTFSGAVDFDTDYTNSFTNNSGATLNLGSAFDIGSSGTLTNDGTISPGGSGSVMTSTITGVFTQGSDGTYLVDVDGSSVDELVFETAGATMAGTVSVNVITAPSASGSADIALSEAGSMDSSGLTIGDTATADYSLDTSSSFYVALEWDVSMDDSDLLGSASRNQSAVAGHLQNVLENGGLGKELTTLLNIVDEDEYIAALDTFASQIASDIQLTSLFSAQRFSDALLSCSVRDGVYRFIDEDQCAWMRAGGSGMERSSSSANRPFTQTAWQFEGGGQFALQDNWFLGTGFSIGTQSLSVDDIADSDGNFYQGGVVAKHTMGNTLLSASLTGGYGDFDITRYLYSSDFAQGNETLWTFSGQLSASHAFVRGDWYLKPRVDIGFDHVNMNGFTETGAGGASLTINDNAQTYYSIQPSIEIGGEIAAANGVLFRPSVSVGLTQFLGDAAPATSASFADTPAGIAPFTIGSEFDTTYFDVTAGLEVLATERLSLSAEGFGQFSDSITSYGGSAKLAIRF